jgi:hypothetical protein
VRLAGCVFIELVVGASVATGVGAGAWFGSQFLRQLGTPDAHAAVVEQPPGMKLGLLAHPSPPPRLTDLGYFLGARDDILTAPLRNGVITKVKFNRGGSSISLRVDFANGGRAAFKPDQTNEQTVPRREVAAYRLSRLIGLDSVAPAIPRKLAFKDLIDKMDPGSADVIPRMREQVVVDADGMVSGELAWWIPTIVDQTLDGIRIDEPDGINAWHRYLSLGETIPPQDLTTVRQISSMLVFDYLTNNTDRFSGSNCKGSPDGRILYFMDNTLSFGVIPEPAQRVRQFLEYSQRFSRDLVTHLRALDEPRLREEIGRDRGPYPQILTDAEIAGVLYRKDRLLEYVDDLIAKHGEDAVLVFP